MDPVSFPVGLQQRETHKYADIAKASVAAGRIIDMRGRDHYDGKLISLDSGNLGENDKGVKIQFNNVWFRYPTRDAPILNGLTLTVRESRLPNNISG